VAHEVTLPHIEALDHRRFPHHLVIIAVPSERLADWPGDRGTAPMSDLEPTDVVASSDSASVLHGGLVAALEGRPFPQLGSRSL